MKIWNNLLNNKLENNHRFKKTATVFFLLLSFIGFVDATYLTISHYQHSSPNCNIISGCEDVLFSSYSTVAGVPVALAGMFYYLTIFILTVHYLNTKKGKTITLTSKLTVLGLLASIYFVYLQIFVIGSFCQFCMLSAIVSTALFALGLSILWSRKKKPKDREELI